MGNSLSPQPLGELQKQQAKEAKVSEAKNLQDLKDWCLGPKILQDLKKQIRNEMLQVAKVEYKFTGTLQVDQTVFLTPHSESLLWYSNEGKSAIANNLHIDDEIKSIHATIELGNLELQMSHLCVPDPSSNGVGWLSPYSRWSISFTCNIQHHNKIQV